MKDDFDFLTMIHEDFLARIEGSELLVKDNISIIKSNIPSFPFNVCFVNNENMQNQKELIINNLNIPLLIYVSSLSNTSFKSWASSNKFIYHKEFPFMFREVQGEFFKSPHYDDIKIYRVRDEINILKDLSLLYAKSKSIDVMQIYKLFQNILPNQYFYISYINDKPAGFFLATSLGDKGFILDTYVEPQYRSIGLLKIMSSKVKEDITSNGVNKFHAFAMSPESENLAIQDKYILKDNMHLWSYSPMI